MQKGRICPKKGGGAELSLLAPKSIIFEVWGICGFSFRKEEEQSFFFPQDSTSGFWGDGIACVFLMGLGGGALLKELIRPPNSVFSLPLFGDFFFIVFGLYAATLLTRLSSQSLQTSKPLLYSLRCALTSCRFHPAHRDIIHQLLPPHQAMIYHLLPPHQDIIHQLLPPHQDMNHQLLCPHQDMNL